MAEKKEMTIKEILIEMCCNDIRHRDEAQKILKCLSALSPIYPHQVRYDELTSYFHSSNDIRVEIAGILQNIDEYSYPLYESLLWITHADLIRIENFETDDDNTLALTVQQCINEAEWARQIEACVSQIPRVKVGDYKHYLAGMKKLTVSYTESSNFFRVVKLMNRINVLGGEDGEIIRDFMLTTCTFDVKVVDEHIRIINYLKSHAEQTTNLIEHHLDIMITLKLIGWYGIDYYYDVLLEKAAIVNFTRTRYAGEEELFDNCCSEILSQPTLGPEERKTIVTNLKLFGEFILLKDYVILMRQFHDTDGHDQSSPLYTTFLETLNQHITLLRRHP